MTKARQYQDGACPLQHRDARPITGKTAQALEILSYASQTAALTATVRERDVIPCMCAWMTTLDGAGRVLAVHLVLCAHLVPVEARVGSSVERVARIHHEVALRRHEGVVHASQQLPRRYHSGGFVE